MRPTNLYQRSSLTTLLPTTLEDINEEFVGRGLSVPLELLLYVSHSLAERSELIEMIYCLVHQLSVLPEQLALEQETVAY